MLLLGHLAPLPASYSAVPCSPWDGAAHTRSALTTLRVCLSQVATEEQLSWSPRLNLGNTFRSILHNGPRKKKWSVLSGAAGFVGHGRQHRLW